MRIEDMKTRPRKSNEEFDNSAEPVWKHDKDGNAILVINKNQSTSDAGTQHLDFTEHRNTWRPSYDDTFKHKKSNDFEEDMYESDE
jgi:hypothetical protein